MSYIMQHTAHFRAVWSSFIRFVHPCNYTKEKNQRELNLSPLIFIYLFIFCFGHPAVQYNLQLVINVSFMKII